MCLEQWAPQCLVQPSPPAPSGDIQEIMIIRCSGGGGPLSIRAQEHLQLFRSPPLLFSSWTESGQNRPTQERCLYKLYPLWQQWPIINCSQPTMQLYPIIYQEHKNVAQFVPFQNYLYSSARKIYIRRLSIMMLLLMHLCCTNVIVQYVHFISVQSYNLWETVRWPNIIFDGCHNLS